MPKISAPTQFLCFSQKMFYLTKAFSFNILLKKRIGVSLEENEKRSQHSRKKRKEGGLSVGALKLVKEIFRNYGPYGLAQRNGNSELNFKILLKTPS